MLVHRNDGVRASAVIEFFFFFQRSLLDAGHAHTHATQLHTTPEGALDTTHEQALTETDVPLSAFTGAAHRTTQRGRLAGCSTLDTGREVWLTAGQTIQQTTTAHPRHSSQEHD